MIEMLCLAEVVDAYGKSAVSGDTTPCRMIKVTLHGVVSPEMEDGVECSLRGGACMAALMVPRWEISTLVMLEVRSVLQTERFDLSHSDLLDGRAPRQPETTPTSEPTGVPRS